MKRPTILVLGAGYGGLMTVVNLQKSLGADEADIVLINKNDYHYESTWLHEAAAGTLSPEQVRYDISSVINSNKVKFIEAEVTGIDVATKNVKTNLGSHTYDYLVIGLGFEGETFGIPGLDKYALSIANVNAARQIRDHMEYQFATWSTEEVKDDSRLTIIVGGAGFTGIEYLGELGNRVPELCKEYDVPAKKVRILCVEAAPMVLPGFDPELVEYAVRQLGTKGVEFSIGTPVVEATPEGVKIKKGEDEFEFIKAGTVVWAAGVRGNHLIEESGIENMRARVKVEKDMRAPGYDDVFVVGDCALMINEAINRPYPPTAQIAMQQGEMIANNIIALMKGNPTREFVPDLKGSVCSLGDSDAIGVVFDKKVTGTKASFMKKMIDNRALFMIGGLGLTIKKGKFNVLK
ncbi:MULTISPECIES: NAD(P)/FAD-dependent oxidoreductase [unclassified Sporosarcina]|uniref:NAD(P)/FAD-dependent oxidoreductase n=1 Tax=unclassified Sporosarcina TaxID=2647733 RepID=UPI000C172440|nr:MULTISPECIES: NAD(P)/FAD-dependent oxidoreductase [unclassified Sporosarcina]PIC99278.1 FAD-dependent oxidoreductase [Sporosarcina sp. P29]PID05363.1 FAD-dependent oxidoreductase [Sporosarcina sp. P30]PID08558.1 FAD-dependent oxidoreductase [Sporosarcina sp. P31]PID11560.1 FAD-dependent oxidoreductase [Sporosarcina sp. P32b]